MKVTAQRTPGEQFGWEDDKAQPGQKVNVQDVDRVFTIGGIAALDVQVSVFVGYVLALGGWIELTTRTHADSVSRVGRQTADDQRRRAIDGKYQRFEFDGHWFLSPHFGQE